jgi:hypothetical protein
MKKVPPGTRLQRLSGIGEDARVAEWRNALALFRPTLFTLDESRLVRGEIALQMIHDSHGTAMERFIEILELAFERDGDVLVHTGGGKPPRRVPSCQRLLEDARLGVGAERMRA